jgi:hypothetical protein
MEPGNSMPHSQGNQISMKYKLGEYREKHVSMYK